MNLSDSFEVEQELIKQGWKKTDNVNHADAVLINTCSVRKTAETRIIGRLGFYKNIKKTKKNLTLLVMGCFAQKDGDLLKKSYPFIDLIIGTQNKNKIPELLNAVKKHKPKKAVFNQFEDHFDFMEPSIDHQAFFRAFLPIIKGCNNYCSYCIVPYTRGREVSIQSSFLLDELKKLIDKGVSEVFLLGQNVNSYGKDISDINFSELLLKISKFKEIKRIKFMTSHPKDFSDELIHAIETIPQVVKHVHLPLQTASNRILKLMNRKYTFEDYQLIIEKLRKKIPDISLSTDILSAFPGETEEEYLQTFEALRTLQFDKAFIFLYSPREGTAAYPLKESLNQKEKKLRVHHMVELQNQISFEKLKRFLHTYQEVIPEKISRKNGFELMGNSHFDTKVIFQGDESDFGKMIQVKIKDVKGMSLIGEK